MPHQLFSFNDSGTTPFFVDIDGGGHLNQPITFLEALGGDGTKLVNTMTIGGFGWYELHVSAYVEVALGGVSDVKPRLLLLPNDHVNPTIPGLVIGTGVTSVEAETVNYSAGTRKFSATLTRPVLLGQLNTEIRLQVGSEGAALSVSTVQGEMWVRPMFSC
jgi:hypothetical protein